MIKSSTLIHITFLLFFLSSNSTQANETVRITNGEWPPYLSKALKHHGVASHIIVESFKPQKIDVEWVFFPWKRAFRNAQHGTWDGSAIWSKSEERLENFFYSEPVIEARGVIFHRKDMPFSWKNYSDLSKYKIGAATGYFYGDDFKKAEDNSVIQVSRVTKDATNFKKILTSRIDLVFVEEDVGLEILKTQFSSEQAAEITNAPKAYRSTTYHLILNKKNPTNELNIKAFNTGLKALRNSGALQKMLSNSYSGFYK
ncbi:hypothetical protein A9Q81_13335 [Gammaproteobacteria bacterium 42_54_T18]|nr:hypothetical protein A9Q81_13335 [Gammaproteobacteria bacterium 42_54_T18]